MRALTARLLIMFLLFGVACQPSEKDAFISLFNGRNLSGWHVVGDPKGFEVRDGCIYTFGRGGGDLFTDDWYGNYIFRLEWMLSPAGNSGIMIRCDTDSAWQTGFEVQLLAPWTPYRDDLHCTGSIYGHVAVSNRPDETTGIWHRMEIVCDRKDITISVDDTVCTRADMDSVEGLRGKNLRGAIGLQSSHSDEEQWVKFRNLKIRDLDMDPDYVLMDFDNPDPQIRKLAQEAAVRLGAPVVGRLCSLTAWGDPMERSLADRALFDIAAAASAPDGDRRYRKAMLKAIKREVKTAESEIIRDFLGRLVSMIENK